MSNPAAPPDIEVVASSYAAAMDRIAVRAQGPVLQIGSCARMLDLKAANWRQRLGHMSFVGLDMEAGDNVDVVRILLANCGRCGSGCGPSSSAR